MSLRDEIADAVFSPYSDKEITLTNVLDVLGSLPERLEKALELTLVEADQQKMRAHVAFSGSMCSCRRLFIESLRGER